MKAQISKAACMYEDLVGLLPPCIPLIILAMSGACESELLVCSLR